MHLYFVPGRPQEGGVMELSLLHTFRASCCAENLADIAFSGEKVSLGGEAGAGEKSKRSNPAEVRINAMLVHRTARSAGRQEGQVQELDLTIRYRFPMPGRRTWDLYRVKLQPGAGSLSVPAWVKEWSTDSDQSPERANRTLHLALLIEAMLRGMTEDMTLCEEVIAISGG
jgi:hypothetical protein